MLILGWYMADICLIYRLVWDWYYLKSLPAYTGIKLVSDLGHTRLVWYLISVFIPILIPVSDPIYQTNTGLDLLLSWRGSPRTSSSRL
jgi:hypothetical protein